VIVALMAGIFAAWFILLASGRKLRRRGYSPPVIGVVALVSVVLGALIDARLFDFLGGEGLGVAVGFVGFLLGTPLLMAAIAIVLPQRGRRRPGERAVRFPLHVALYATAAICAAGVLGLLSLPFLYGPAVLGDNLSKVLIPLLAVTAALVVAGGRVRKQTQSPRRVAEAMQADIRAPVLYLREFAYERQPFIAGHASEMQPYLARSHRWVPEFLRPEWSTEATVTVEEYLVEAIERSLGPLVALGSPEDYLQPLGAAREYAADENWQQRFAQLAAEARAVLLVPGTSNQLSWELETLLRRGYASKLFIMVGSVTFAASSLWKIGFLYGWKQAKWPAYHALMESVGYTIPADCPRPLSIMGFDREGRATLISNGGAISPDAYVHAMETHLLRQGQRVKVSEPGLAHVLGDGVGRELERAHNWMERIGLAENASFGREMLLILGVLIFQGALIVSAFELVPSFHRYAFGFGGSSVAYFALCASSGALCGALFVSKGERLKASIAGTVAGLGALAALMLGLGWTGSHSKELFGLLELVGVLPGMGLFFLLDRGFAQEAVATPLPAVPTPGKDAAWTYDLNCLDAMDELLLKLNRIGPWAWTLRSSATYGSYLTCRPATGIRARIHRDQSQCTALLQIEDGRATRAAIDAAFTGLLLQAGIDGRSATQRSDAETGV
jgi:hypothetical protein